MEKKSVIKKITGSREALLAIIVIVLFAVVTAISPSFLTPKSLMEMLKNNAVTMVMSLGMSVFQKHTDGHTGKCQS